MGSGETGTLGRPRKSHPLWADAAPRAHSLTSWSHPCAKRKVPLPRSRHTPLPLGNRVGRPSSPWFWLTEAPVCARRGLEPCSRWATITQQAGPADFYALALLTVSQAGPVRTPEPCQGRYVPTRQTRFSGSKVQREAAGTDPELQESDVTTLASPHSMLIILKAMRPSIKAGAGVTPLSTSGRVGRAGSTSSGGCTADTVGRAAGPHAQPKARGSGGERAAASPRAVGLLWPSAYAPPFWLHVPSRVRVPPPSTPTLRCCPCHRTQRMDGD